MPKTLTHPGIKRALYVSIHPRRQMISKLGASSTTPGIVIDASMNVSIAVRPRKRYFASAYPPIEQNRISRTVEADARNSELATYCQNETGPFTLWLGA